MKIGRMETGTLWLYDEHEDSEAEDEDGTENEFESRKFHGLGEEIEKGSNWNDDDLRRPG